MSMDAIISQMEQVRADVADIFDDGDFNAMLAVDRGLQELGFDPAAINDLMSAPAEDVAAAVVHNPTETLSV